MAAKPKVSAQQYKEWNLTNISGTISLPTGASTSDNQESLLETKIDSNEGKNIRTSNVNSESTQNEILKQLKIMNIQLAILTGNEIEKTEV